MIIYYKNQPGYNEPLLHQTNLACPKLFVINEFDFIVFNE